MDRSKETTGTGSQQPMTGQSPGTEAGGQTTDNDLNQSNTGEQQNTGTLPREGLDKDKDLGETG